MGKMKEMLLEREKRILGDLTPEELESLMTLDTYGGVLRKVLVKQGKQLDERMIKRVISANIFDISDKLELQYYKGQKELIETLLRLDEIVRKELEYRENEIK